MKALRWYGTRDVRVGSAPDPEISNNRDAIIRVTTTAICGSDLHLYRGVVPTMQKGDILGHEFMGEVVEVGDAVGNLSVGDRVVVPFAIACGNCFFCRRGLWSACDNSNPNAWMVEKQYGYSCAGMFGYSHMFGGYPGGQAEYVRVPFADVGPCRIPEEMTDEQVLFLSDILPTGYMAAENCNIQPGDTVAVWGCGPVGQFAIQSALWLGAEQVIAIDDIPGRLELARKHSGVKTIDFSTTSVPEALDEMTSGLGPDACIDAVGLEAHGSTPDAVYDRVKHAMRLTTDRIHALREAIHCCRKGGTVSIPGVYAGFVDKLPLGAAFGKGLTFKMGQTHVHAYMPRLLEHLRGTGSESTSSVAEDHPLELDDLHLTTTGFDPACIISHTLPLDEAADGYRMFDQDPETCTKVVLKP
jgi:threonine dehydrogenase-like Zn-dependent dehydrogenase